MTRRVHGDHAITAKPETIFDICSSLDAQIEGIQEPPSHTRFSYDELSEDFMQVCSDIDDLPIDPVFI